MTLPLIVCIVSEAADFGAEACQELGRVLRHVVHREGAAAASLHFPSARRRPIDLDEIGDGDANRRHGGCLRLGITLPQQAHGLVVLGLAAAPQVVERRRARRFDDGAVHVADARLHAPVVGDERLEVGLYGLDEHGARPVGGGAAQPGEDRVPRVARTDARLADVRADLQQVDGMAAVAAARAQPLARDARDAVGGAESVARGAAEAQLDAT